ncbi:MAG: acetate--CoA ligase family protein [Deltaproteobacteria bacterium]|nr:acetate--CoA ligase family protein [Deltaproteobacteria bacterium]
MTASIELKETRPDLGVVKEILACGHKTLTEPQTLEILRAYSVPVPRFKVVGGVDEALEIAKGLRYPLVLKIVSHDIGHKTDVGGVTMGLRDKRDLQDAWSQMMLDIADDEPRAFIEGFLLEEMAPRGTEVIIGAIRDEQFGPAVMFGVGGIEVELIKDVAFRLAPVSRQEAFDMMNEVKGISLLTGWRGGGIKDFDAVVNAIMRVSDIICENDEINEIEIVYHEGAVAVDGRAVLK